MLDGSLSGEQRSQYVGIENPMEVVLGDRLDRSEFINAGIVNQDVEASVIFDGGVNDSVRAGGFGYVALYGDGGPAGFLNGGDDVISPGLTRSIVDHDGGAFCGQGFNDTSADAFGCAGNDCDFPF